MENSTKSVKEVIEAEAENRKCADCGAARPQWASVTHGIFLCLNCAGIHRSFGVKTSVVKSVAMDLWSVPEIKKMEIGGNRRFLALVKEKGLESVSKKALYYERPIQRYRDSLSKQVEELFPEPRKRERDPEKKTEREKKSSSAPGRASAAATPASSTPAYASSSRYASTYSEKRDKYTVDALQTNITSAIGKAAGYLYTGATTLSGHISEKVISPASSMIKEKSQQLSEYMKKKETSPAQEKRVSPEKKKEAFDKWD